MLKIYNDGERVTAAICGDIDHHAARELRVELDEVIARSRPRLLILDLGGIGIMDSSGVGLIIGRMNRLRECGGELLIKNARDETAELLRLCGLEGLVVSLKAARHDS